MGDMRKSFDYMKQLNKERKERNYDGKVMCGDVVGFIRNRTEQVT